MVDEQNISIINKQRRNAIIDYVKKNPQCYKEKVVEHCTRIEVASRMTARKIIDELKQEGILNVYKEKNNSKSYKLVVNSENLLLIIPQDLEEIFVQFKNFVDIVNKIPIGKDEIHSRVENSIYHDCIDEEHYDKLQQSVSLLPCIMIDVINDVFTFSFIFTLNKKIDKSYLPKIYPNYFEIINKMYLYVSEGPRDDVLYYKNGSSHDSYLYQDYLESKKYSNFIKVSYLAYLCTIFGIEENLYKVLDLLWVKNVDTVSLMYYNDLEKIFFRYNNHKNRSSIHPYLYHNVSQLKKYDEHYMYNNDILNKIHEGLNYFIVMDEGLFR